jgi:hypothetical protein
MLSQERREGNLEDTAMLVHFLQGLDRIKNVHTVFMPEEIMNKFPWYYNRQKANKQE